MTLRIETTDYDHIPEEFTIESLKEGGFTDQEIELLSTGDDPIVTPTPDPAEATPADALPLVTDGDEPDIAEQTAAEPAPAAESEPAPVVAPVVAPVEDVADPKMPEIPDTTEAEAYVTKSKEQLKELLDKYDQGDLTQEEYGDQQNFIISEQARAQAAITAAASVADQAATDQQKHWYGRLEAYKATAPDLWNDEHKPGWDRQLREVTGNKAYADLSRDGQIKMAHSLYSAEYEARNGKALAMTPKADAKVDKGPEDKLEVKTGEKPKAPQTLADFNSDTGADVEDSHFAAVDKQIMRDPLGAEKSFASMTEEQQDRYLEEV
jgi:hypothetical protein